MSWHFIWWTVGGCLGLILGLAVLRARGIVVRHGVAILLIAGALAQFGAKLQYRLQSMSVSEALAAPVAEYYRPGMRLPLALVLGGAGGVAACAALGVPCLVVGDALALAASVMMTIGRLGCFAAGCCMGTPCPAWMPYLCPRFPAGSETHTQQLRAGLIELGSAYSLPVHPLPAYFGIASLGMLVLLLWLLHQKSNPGAALAWFCLLGSSSKLALEYLRGSAPNGPVGLMFWLPVLGIAAAAVVLASLGRVGRAPAAAP